MARNAVQILQRSITDINDGHWCQNDLGGSVNDKGNRMACAVGLLSFWGGHTNTYHKATYLRYPSDDGPKPVIKALEALYFTLPKKRQFTKKAFEAEVTDFRRVSGEVSDETVRNIMMEQAVVSFNDLPTTTEAKAAVWFQRALDYLRERNVTSSKTANELAAALS